METRQLRYFIAVAEERHFGRAAQRLHMAQPPLSQQIMNLEAELEVQLLRRTTRRVDLTEAGQLLLERGRTILSDIETLVGDIYHVSQGAQGVLRIGITGSAVYRHLPRIIQQARERFPRVHLDVYGEMMTPQLEHGLLSRSLEVAVLRPPVSSVEIRTMFLEDEDLVAAIPEDSPLASRGLLTLEDLRDENFIAYPKGSSVYEAVFAWFARESFVPRTVHQVHETSTLLSTVAANVGVGLTPASTRHFAVRGMVLRPLRQAPKIGLSLAWLAANESPLVRNFVSIFAPEEERSLPDADSSD